ncbi:hypothetical protein PPROV_000878100 [Pycnococcus provasolii]|uniref:Branched-chain-amino-acid aminotransferase n=1 Tax=Pycnococcus provasolii TaxID=41880 RepID=A0A830HSU0_9CHLO|nr:hypothetical protein PPROV_000878100 [Pycnococcus provasolii]
MAEEARTYRRGAALGPGPVSIAVGASALEGLGRVLHVWSGPRCRSTALMYAFHARGDCEALDEPLYAHYLVSHPHAKRQYRDELLATMDGDASRVVHNMTQRNLPQGATVRYCKHMAKQARRLPAEQRRAVLASGAHVLLVRTPIDLILSFAKVEAATFEETGYADLVQLYADLVDVTGTPPLVVDSDTLNAHPEGVLRAMCAHAGIKFTPNMLTWPAGPKPCDGMWAPYWYDRVWASTGLDPTDGAKKREVDDERDQPFPPELVPLLELCLPMYDTLRRLAISPADLPVAELEGGDEGVDGDGQQKGIVGQGTHRVVKDMRNERILVGIRDGVSGRFELRPRSLSHVSVLDAGFVLGDGVWEGIRVHQGVCLFLADHIERLFEGAKGIAMNLALTKEELARHIYRTLDANAMTDNVHIRLMATRGLKPTPYQNPQCIIGDPTIVVLAEHKKADPETKTRGISLGTCPILRGPANVQDPMWNSHSKLNCIAACIHANFMHVDEAIMLDPHGFVATCNSTNLFMVRRGEVWAPTTKYQLHGITRYNILVLCHQAGIPIRECDFSLTQLYSADEAFVTGTFAGQIPVTKVDGRVIGDGARGPITERLQTLYATMCDAHAALGRATWADPPRVP